MARVAKTQASTSANQSTGSVVSTPTCGGKVSRAHVQKLKEPAPASIKERMPAPAAARRTKEPAPAAARKGKEPAPAAARKGKEPAPAGRKDKGSGAGTQMEIPPPPTRLSSSLRLQGIGWSLPPPAAAAAPLSRRPRLQRMGWSLPPLAAAAPPPPLSSCLRLQGMGRSFPPAAAAPPPPVDSHLRLQGMGWSLPPPAAAAAPLPPLSRCHRRQKECSPASIGYCSACPLQIQWV
ncbi:hypothetical protein NDU88_000144 [Pleurodeles waltl]|uniref:Uncharacterized protein n=1 Tax=Pleurodeles waltl TaxID=8319 RepID=A0AAV7SW33_PLEWA|nr:hypothetical protein NDU88_000144 [Pleurodeles waltl]